MNQDYSQHPEYVARPDPVSPAIIHKALLRMRNVARGNGINPDTITLDGFEGSLISFAAKSLFEVKTTVAKKSLPGKEKGEVCGSAADLHGRIQMATERTTIDTGIIDFATEFLERRKDMGFMQDGLGLKLERLNRTFLFYNTCTNCTAGRINCMACQGAGLVNCVRCRGARTIVCTTCRGARTIKNQNGKMGPCRKCNGHGEIACTFCHSTGRIKCKPCVGSGQTPCTRCAATGIISDMAYVTFEAKTHFLYDRDALPENLPPLLERLGPKIATEKHADIRILHEKEQRAAQIHHETTENVPVRDELVVPLFVQLPWGKIRFRIDDRAVSNRLVGGRLFGQHARLLNMPPFLEKPISPGLDRLTQAAHGLGHVWNNIHQAVAFRVIADAMAVAAAMPPKKAALTMRKRWSVGVSGDVTDKLTLLADQAYKNVSKLPRIAGLLLGLALGAGIDAAYLIGPGRQVLYSLLIPKTGALAGPIMIGADIALVAALGFLAHTTSRLVTKKALRKLFLKLLPPKQLNAIKPKSGSVGVYAYAGSVLVFGAVIAAALLNGHKVPDWVSHTLALIR